MELYAALPGFGPQQCGEMDLGFNGLGQASMQLYGGLQLSGGQCVLGLCPWISSVRESLYFSALGSPGRQPRGLSYEHLHVQVICL